MPFAALPGAQYLLTFHSSCGDALLNAKNIWAACNSGREVSKVSSLSKEGSSLLLHRSVKNSIIEHQVAVWHAEYV